MSARLHVRVGPIGFSGPIGKQEVPSYGWCGHDTEIAAMFCKECPRIEAEYRAEQSRQQVRGAIHHDVMTPEQHRADTVGTALCVILAFASALMLVIWIGSAVSDSSALHWTLGLILVGLFTTMLVVGKKVCPSLSPEQQAEFDRRCAEAGVLESQHG